MTTKPNPMPDMYRTVTPTLIVKDASAAIDFYKRAFGAQEIRRTLTPDGSKIMHAAIRIGDSMIMLSDEFIDMGCLSPESLKGVASGIWLYVPDADASYKKAIDSGADSICAPVDMFWGDRFSKIKDPFGQEWTMATHIEDLSEKEVIERRNAFFAQAACAKG